MRSAVLFASAAVSVLLGGAPKAEPARPVRVQVVELSPTETTWTYPGTVQARVVADLSFRVSGKVVDRPVNLGDYVKSGQVIARLDPADLALTIEADEQAVAAAQAASANARSEFSRMNSMGRESAAFLPAEFDKRQAAMLSADARLAQSRRQLALAQAQLSYATLRADADGRITALPVQVGQVVSVGQTVAALAHAADTEVSVDVPENRLGEVRTATAVAVMLWSDPHVWLRGRLREVGALADATSRTFAVRVSLLDRPETVGLGMTAAVRFTGPASAPVATLPSTALVDDRGRPAVWVLDPARRRAALRRVQVAAYEADDAVVVTSGLAAGEAVVTAGASQLDAETPVTAWRGPIH